MQAAKDLREMASAARAETGAVGTEGHKAPELAYGEFITDTAPDGFGEASPEIKAICGNVYDALCDDLNTPVAIAHIFDAVRIINSAKDRPRERGPLHPAEAFRRHRLRCSRTQGRGGRRRESGKDHRRAHGHGARGAEGGKGGQGLGDQRPHQGRPEGTWHPDQGHKGRYRVVHRITFSQPRITLRRPVRAAPERQRGFREEAEAVKVPAQRSEAACPTGAVTK